MNVRTLIISDIHNTWENAEKIIKLEDVDNVVFLGDYFDNFGDDYRVASETADWLAGSLTKKNRIHIMGNHDANYAFPHRSYKCGGYQIDKDEIINLILKETDWKKLPLYTWVGSWLCTHAGLHTHFYDKYSDGIPLKSWLEETCDVALKTAFENKPAVQILRAGYDRGGSEVYGGIYWGDWCEFKPIVGINQVFGHSPQRKPQWLVRGNLLNKDYTQNLCLDVSHCIYYGIHESKTDKITVHWIGDL